MADFEIAYNAYKNCSDPKFDCNKCIYLNNCKQLDADILELLKDQKERITVLEEEAKIKGTPQKVLNRKELADLIVGECPLCGALFNNEICPTACGWCGCLLDWKDGEQE